MFWKQKKTKRINISLPFNERRNYYRVCPDTNTPVIITINGKDYAPLNISAGGVSIQTELNIPPGEIIEVILEIKGYILPLKTDALIIQSQGILRLSFPELEEEEREKIHLFVLDTEKNIIRQKKGRLG